MLNPDLFTHKNQCYPNVFRFVKWKIAKWKRKNPSSPDLNDVLLAAEENCCQRMLEKVIVPLIVCIQPEHTKIRSQEIHGAVPDYLQCFLPSLL